MQLFSSMRCSSALLLMLSLGCTHTVEEPTFATGGELGSMHAERLDTAEPAVARTRSAGEVRFRMQRHFDDLRNLESMLVAGRLAEARSLAFMLSRPIHDPSLTRWPADAARVSTAALALSRATSIEQAFGLEAILAEACAGCHLRAGARLAFEETPPPPPDGPTAKARMARHRWAADRVAKGMLSGSDRPWREGLEVFVATGFASSTDVRGHRVQALARAALANHTKATHPQRAKIYGELLGTCGACHASRR